MPSSACSLQNQFLIAMPQMADPNFNGALTYICQHNDEGAMGIVFNRPSNLLLEEIFNQLSFPTEGKYSKTLVFSGGPVQQERGFVLHTDKNEWQSSFKVSDKLHLTTSKDILEALAKERGPDQFLIALGYAGWGAGQLEQELSENTWLTCEASDEILFHTSHTKMYDSALASLGITAANLSTQAGHA